MFNIFFTIYGLLIDWNTYDIFEKQFHVLKLCFICLVLLSQYKVYLLIETLMISFKNNFMC